MIDGVKLNIGDVIQFDPLCSPPREDVRGFCGVEGVIVTIEMDGLFWVKSTNEIHYLIDDTHVICVLEQV